MFVHVGRYHTRIFDRSAVRVRSSAPSRVFDSAFSVRLPHPKSGEWSISPRSVPTTSRIEAKLFCVRNQVARAIRAVRFEDGGRPPLRRERRRSGVRSRPAARVRLNDQRVQPRIQGSGLRASASAPVSGTGEPGLNATRRFPSGGASRRRPPTGPPNRNRLDDHKIGLGDSRGSPRLRQSLAVLLADWAAGRRPFPLVE